MKTDKHKIKVYGLFLLLTLAVGGLAAIFTSSGMERYALAEKPPLTPPDILFPVVWTILYALMGISAARVWLTDNSRLRNHGTIVYFLQLFFNFFWSIIFFSFQAYGFAFLWIIILWALIILMIVKFYKVDKIAGLLQIPYLLWVSFATYLTGAVWVVNR